MKCPACGEQLKPSKKNPEYVLCYTCKKKYKLPKKAATVAETPTTEVEAPRRKKAQAKPEETEPKYSNIPPKSVREEREENVRNAYDEMLDAGETKKSKKDRKAEEKARKAEEKAAKRKARYEEEDDDYGYDDDDVYEDDDYDDDYDYDDEEEESVSKAPIIILLIAIIIVIAMIAYMIGFKSLF